MQEHVLDHFWMNLDASGSFAVVTLGPLAFIAIVLVAGTALHLRNRRRAWREICSEAIAAQGAEFWQINDNQ